MAGLVPDCRHAAVALALAILVPAPVAGQDFFPGFETAAEADAIHLTGVVLSHVVDDTCTFGPDVLVDAAGRALARHEIDVLRMPEAPEKGVVFDVSALVLPVLGTDSCAVATRLQLTIKRGERVLLAAEYFNLIAWTVTGLVQRIRASVDRDVSIIADALSEAREPPVSDREAQAGAVTNAGRSDRRHVPKSPTDGRTRPAMSTRYPVAAGLCHPRFALRRLQ